MEGLKSSLATRVQLKYLLGMSHNRCQILVWNRVYNFYGYSCSNLLVIQGLDNSQKVVTFPAEITCLLQTPDHQRLFLGVAGQVYVLDA